VLIYPIENPRHSPTVTMDELGKIVESCLVAAFLPSMKHIWIFNFIYIYIWGCFKWEECYSERWEEWIMAFWSKSTDHIKRCTLNCTCFYNYFPHLFPRASFLLPNLFTFFVFSLSNAIANTQYYSHVSWFFFNTNFHFDLCI
jgi:hypothetical protein